MVANAPAIIVVLLYVHDHKAGSHQSVEHVTATMVPTQEAILEKGGWKKMHKMYSFPKMISLLWHLQHVIDKSKLIFSLI